MDQTSKGKIDSIVEKLERAKGFVLGISVMALHQDEKFGNEAWQIQIGISTALRQSIELYREIEDKES